MVIFVDYPVQPSHIFHQSSINAITHKEGFVCHVNSEGNVYFFWNLNNLLRRQMHCNTKVQKRAWLRIYIGIRLIRYTTHSYLRSMSTEYKEYYNPGNDPETVLIVIRFTNPLIINNLEERGRSGNSSLRSVTNSSIN